MVGGPAGRGGRVGGDTYRHEFRGRRAPAAVRLDVDLGVRPIEVGEVRTGGELFGAARVRAAADLLGVPLVNRRVNDAAAAPVYFYRVHDSLEFAELRPTFEVALTAFRPSPAVVVDAHWRIVAANPGVALLTAGITPVLRRLPLNLLELALSPGGFFSRVGNTADWRAGWRELVSNADPQPTLDAHLRRLLEFAPEVGQEPQNGHIDIGVSTYSERVGAAGTKTRPCDIADIGTSVVPVDSSIGRTRESKRFGVPLRLRCGNVDLSFLVTDSSDESSPEESAHDWHVIAFLPADELTVRLMHELIPVATSAAGDEVR